jgi:hypothetical protein
MEQPMQSLSPEKILAVWETGRPQHALDRALTILAAATPGATRADLADLSIGERDTRLLQLRFRVFGPGAEGFAECPHCLERIEFPLDTAAFTPPPEERESARPVSASFPELRAPTSRDLAAIVAAPNEATALRLLLERCGGSPDLPNDAVEALSRDLLALDPQAEINLRLTCPACDQGWELAFDVAEFFWKEIAAQAQRLLREIDILARAYGWTEREILNLPAARRQTYLELLAA